MKKASATIRVSPDHEIPIPALLQEEAGIKPGMELEVVITERGLRLVPIRPLMELRGILRRDDTVPLRDKGDRF